jgi:acyl-CoA reductase-like NAD-dependent aldehyde dehydrogenase
LRSPRISAGWPEPDVIATIIVHTLAQAIAALSAAERAGRPVLLVSASDAGGYVGPGWFKALTAAAREAVPDARCSSLLDCGDNVGAALAAIRAEVEGVIFTGRPDVARRLADIARQHRAHFETKRPVDALDLGEDFFATQEDLERRCAEFLG